MSLQEIQVEFSVADPGSSAFLTPGSGIRNRFFKPIFLDLFENFLGKKIYNSLKIGNISKIKYFSI
jgi:hypothetical protein